LVNGGCLLIGVTGDS